MEFPKKILLHFLKDSNNQKTVVIYYGIGLTSSWRKQKDDGRNKISLGIKENGGLLMWLVL